MARFQLTLLLLVLSLAGLSGCGKDDGSALEIALVGSPEGLTGPGTRLSNAAQLVRGATADGLVRLDESGEVVPGLADRWIVTDDGRSYIFRIADREWPDGRPLDGETVAASLKETLRDLRRTSLGLDLAKISEIRSMAGRVVEIDLYSPMPDLLQLLAQPEMGLFRNRKASGLMTAQERDGKLILTMVRPETLGQPEVKGWSKLVRPLDVSIIDAQKAIERFNSGEVDVVLGGQFETMPVSDAGPLSRGNVRLDGVTGLLGVQIVGKDGFLSDPVMREALAMSVNRDALVQSFNIGGWQATTRIVPPGLPNDPGTIGERWANRTIEERQQEAARRLASWREDHDGAELTLTLSMPEGAVSNMVFRRLRSDFAKAGVKLERKGPDEKAQLKMVDAVARFADPRWFLNQFHCSLRRGQCSPAADATVAEAIKAPDAASEAELLAEAEAELTVANVYIPLGAPLRWSLVRGSVSGFEPNRLGFHPLPPLARIGN